MYLEISVCMKGGGKVLGVESATLNHKRRHQLQQLAIPQEWEINVILVLYKVLVGVSTSLDNLH